MDKNSDIKIVKYNKVVIASSSDKSHIINTFKDFFAKIKAKTKGLQGFVIMSDDNSGGDNFESIIIVLTFWKNKEDMDEYYKPENKDLSELVKSVKPLLKQMPERTNYIVSEFVIESHIGTH
jgi:heme-degrading monooxygenase HmoA